MAHRSVGHPVGFGISLQVERRRQLDGPHLRAMTMNHCSQQSKSLPLRNRLQLQRVQHPAHITLERGIDHLVLGDAAFAVEGR